MTEPMTEDPITHPEEIRGGFELRLGEKISLKGQGRITPAGIVSAGIITVAILVATAALVRAARR
ncbi:hypothetical protein J4G43_038090 [Bradyrhizobium barranii subsp. barranii]|uniref:Uncharacterized protein n=1 Tax=Bradyrhizobium barranii subsp. barranii TaxID=2823807 RepID=A0A939S7T9_9BRAD|nr:hypothetical protein [Bradyrhizobium barranii]UEM10424.1 hypothetical protein J4G43_038090 [Bradyrhizobium barranii subsp. barranii]